MTRRLTLQAIAAILSVVAVVLVVANASGPDQRAGDVEHVSALREASSGAANQSSDPDAPPANRPDLQPESTMVVEGTVVDKDILSVKNRPEIKYSSNPDERSDQRAVAEFDRYRAEFDVQVDNWVEGNGPARIRIVRGVAFEGLDLTASASTDWVNREYYDAVQVGARYRFLVNEDRFFKGNFYDLLSTADEGYERID